MNRVTINCLLINFYINCIALFDTNEAIPWNWMTTGSNYTLKCPQNEWDDPPYRTKAVYRWDGKNNRAGRLSDLTLCMSAVQGEIDPETNKLKYRHYDVHNLYGWSETKITLDTMREITGKRSSIACGVDTNISIIK